MTNSQHEELSFEITDEEVVLPKPEKNKIVFEISGEQYLRYIRWKQEIEERIARQELETKKRFFDGEKLSPNQLSKIKKQLETGEVEIYYGVIEEGYAFTFYTTSVIDIVKVKNTLTGEEIDLTDYDTW